MTRSFNSLTNCLEGTSLPQCTSPLSPACLTSSQAPLDSTSSTFPSYYPPAQCQPLPLLTDRKHSSHPGFFCCRSSGSTKRQHSASGELEVRMLRDRAAGPSSFYTSILHLPITLRSPGSLPRSHSSQHHRHTRLTSALVSLGLCSLQGLRTLS